MGWIERFDPSLMRIAMAGDKPERAIQAKVITWARAMEPRMPDLKYLIAIPNDTGFSGTFKQNVARAMQAKRAGVKPGPSDLFLPVPRHGLTTNIEEIHATYAGLWIEMKAVGLRPHPDKPGKFQVRVGDVKPEQKDWLHDMRGFGFATAICWSEGQATALLTAYLKGRYDQRPLEWSP
jgi:hypothetical protein